MRGASRSEAVREAVRGMAKQAAGVLTVHCNDVLGLWVVFALALLASPRMRRSASRGRPLPTSSWSVGGVGGRGGGCG